MTKCNIRFFFFFFFTTLKNFILVILKNFFFVKFSVKFIEKNFFINNIYINDYL